MREMKRTIGKGALVALILWFALAAGIVWASDHGTTAATGEGMPTADAHVSAEMHGEAAAGHAVVEDHATETAALHGDAAAGHGNAHAVDSLSPAKLKDLGWRVMNFIVLMIILVKFGAKPIANGLGARRKQIRDEIEDLEAKKVDAEKAYKEFSAKLESVEKDVDSIVEKAVAQAEVEKVRIIEAAEKSAADIKRSAEMAIANEITAAKRSLKVSVTEQAAIMAEELIVKNLTADDQVKIIEDYLDKVGAVQ
ncbi:F0F1-type ATP synthase, beta subunit [Desulfocapsa sulfexigens DSM 10523]|uniref:ATP synthase subunit b n=2 Tax=Desulfocapsa TaxID=53318 RepID=M1PPA9_DESSD|nr:F0F1-type ATP synthase, beta subunit [Desulfocapsa sulfexigens DSM 10523]